MKIMKRLTVLIALMLVVTISGVYATWTYTQSTDVADESVNMALNLTNVTYAGTYGTYEIDKSGLTLAIDPLSGSVHDTGLYITGQLVIKFTPDTYANETIKANGVDSTFKFSLSNDNWKYNDDGGEDYIVTLAHPEAHDIIWVNQPDGSFTFTLDATALAEHISLTAFTLDTKTDYDAYNAALANGQIILTVSDGTTAGQP